MTTLYKILSTVILVICLLHLPQLAKAEEIFLQDISIDECDGSVYFKFKVFRESWCGTKLPDCGNAKSIWRIDGSNNHVYFIEGGRRTNILQMKGGEGSGASWVVDGVKCKEGVGFYPLESYQFQNLGVEKNSRGSIDGCDDRNQEHVVKLKFLLPKSLYGKILQFGISGNFNGDNFTNGGNMIRVPAFPQLTGLRLTPLCGSVKLDWTTPTNFACSNAKYEYQSGTADISGELDIDQTTFASGIQGGWDGFTNHTWNMRVRFTTAIGDLYSDWITVNGSPIKNVTTPTALKVTQPTCATAQAEIQTKIEWVSDPTNLPDKFIVERSLSTSFNSWETLTDEVTKDRSWLEDDENFNFNTPYYYRVTGVNNTCGTSATSSTKSIYINNAPDAPSAVMTTLLPDNTIRVNWNHNGQRAKGFTIIRTPLDNNGTNRQETFDLNTLTSHIDDYIPNCANYQYEVKANSKCFNPVGSTNRPQIVFVVNDITTTFGPGSLKASKGFFPDKVKLQWNYSNIKEIDNFIIYRRPLGSTAIFEQIHSVAAPNNIWEDQSGTAGQLYEYGIVAQIKNCGGGPLYSNSHPSLGDDYQSVGFRSPTALVNGKITYNGGIALEGAKVVAAKAESSKQGTSLNFDGSTRVEINDINNPNASAWMPRDNYALSLWLKPENSVPNMTVLHKFGSTNISHALDIQSTSVVQDTAFVFYADTVMWMNKGGIFAVKKSDLVYLQDSSSIIGRFRNDTLKIIEKTYQAGFIENDTVYKENGNSRIITGIIGRDIVAFKDTIYEPALLSITKPIKKDRIAKVLRDTIYSLDKDSIYHFIKGDTLYKANYYFASTKKGSVYGSISTVSGKVTIFPVENPTSRRFILGNTITSSSHGTGTVLAFIIKDTLYHANYGLGTIARRGDKFAIREGNIIYHLVPSTEIKISMGVAYGIMKGDTVYSISNPTMVANFIKDSSLYAAKYLTINKIVKGARKQWLEANTIFSSNRANIDLVAAQNKLYTFDWVAQGKLIGDTIKSFTNKSLYVLEPDGKLFEMLHFQTINSVKSFSGITPRKTYNLRYTSFIGSELKTVIADSLFEDEFTNVMVTKDASKLRIFANGEIKDSINISGSIAIGNQPLILGAANVAYGSGFDYFYKGKMDELLIWNTTLTNLQIKQNYGRYLIGNEPGIVAYYRLDENAGGRIYDASRNDAISDENNRYNKHDGRIVGNVGWSDQAPDPEILGFAGFTDKKGNYSIPAIRFAGNGENFKVVPIFQTHEFSPSNSVLFLGEGSVVQNNINFLDKSSFKVTGFVRLDTTGYGANTCFIENVIVKIDGRPVVSNSKLVQTDSKGKFEIQVPIGDHTISVEKQGNTFSLGKWPVNTETHNFQEDITGITFKNNTKRIVLGKVVGGKEEGDKFPGFGHAINNLGVARIEYLALGNECMTKSIFTNSSSGEYITTLPALQFRVKNLNIATQGAGFNEELKALADEIIDLTVNFEKDPFQKMDTTFHVGNGDKTPNNIASIKTVNYHKIKDYIYQATPKIFVTDKNGNEFRGDSSIIYSDPRSVNGINIPAYAYNASLGKLEYTFGHPLFTSGANYELNVAIKEEYENTDSGNRYPYFVKDAAVEITNNIADTKDKLSLAVGQTTIKFTAAKPNMLQSTKYSYTKSIDILGTKGARWEPNSGSLLNDKIFRGYVLGSQLKENLDFVTDITDPIKQVDFIIRDPPGSKSKTVLKQGTKIVKKSTSSFGVKFEVTQEITTGLDLEVYDVQLSGVKLLKQEGSTAIESSRAISAKGEFEYTWTQAFGSDISTNDVAYLPGARSDVFVGTGVNVLFGLSDQFHLIPANTCSLPKVVCVGPTILGLALGKKESYALVPEKDFSTQFFYTADHIENEIKGLYTKRNSLFDGIYYETYLPQTHELFGANNNDRKLLTIGLPISGSKGIETDQGASYIYRRDLVKTTRAVDLVRKYNNQISLWKQVLAINEEEKVNLINNSLAFANPLGILKAPLENYSFGYGPSFTQSMSSENGYSYNVGGEIEVGLLSTTKLGGTYAGTKLEYEGKIGGSVTTGTEYEDEKTTETVWEFTLEEKDINDQISVDVIQSQSGNGPVFVTKAGRTSCPHEPEYRTKYYQPGTLLSGGTMQRDQPSIRVTPNKLTNIDDKGNAVFMLELGNENREDSVRNYIVKYDTRTNLGGSFLRLDGKSLALKYDIAIPGGQSFLMPLVVSRGPFDFNYDNIKLIMYSPCQFSFGQSFERSIYDSTSLSVHFLPTCSDAAIKSPNTKWILNNSFKDTLGLSLGGYDINTPGLKDLRLQFKKTSQSEAEWLTWNTFWKGGHPDKPKDPAVDSIPTTKGNIDYAWVVSQLTDGDYELRMQTTCLVKESPDPVKVVSGHITGTIDRINPHPFGTPSPGDGILSPNDDISIQFNEDIEAGKLTWDNFEVKGVLNGSELRHDASIYFDGSTEKYMKVKGLLLQNQSFTIEFWAKRSTTGEEIMLAQGVAGTPEMFVGFDANNKLKFSLNGTSIVADKAITDQKWHHLSLSYDYDENRAYLYGDGELLGYDENFVADYKGSGSIMVGRRNFAPYQAFKGNIHELRIWKKSMPLTDVVINLGKTMSGREIGLVGCWPMDEAGGKLAQDKANKRNGEVSAEWAVEPSSKSMAFSSANKSYIEAKGAKAAFTAEMDFTVEFWFKAAQAGNYTLFSNGKGDLQDSSKTDWAISSNITGKIIVSNNGKLFTAVDSNFFNNTWHHFALVVNRLGNTSAFIDGELQNSASRLGWTGFGGAKLWLGARGWYIGNTKNFDNNFNGKLDEVRVWGLARKQEQIKTDMHNRLHGHEFGLASYYSFEAYQKDAAGIMLLEETLREQSIVRDNITKAVLPNDTAVAILATYSDDTPKIKLPRPVENVNFIYSVNKDKIIFSLTDEPKRVENCILDVTVRNIQDLRGNQMQSPATWTAYIDKNQVVWEGQEFVFRKKLYDTLSFSAYILNQGGNGHDFVIDNLPLWLKAEPARGKIKPNSRLKIQFTVNEGLNIGNYNESLYLRTSFGFNEMLALNVKVFQPAPADWKVNPANFQFSASMVGQVKVDNILSTDPEDKIAAFVGNECRGVASLSYIEVYDTYQAFLNIYSNESSSEKVDFRIWDASQGLTLINVTPFVGTVPNYNFTFEANKVLGSTSKPVIWNSLNGVLRRMPLPKGWKWISLGLKSDALFRTSLLFKDLNLHDGDEFKGAVNFDRYDSTTTKWFGNLAGDNMSLRIGGLRNEQSYKVKLQKADTLNYRGSIINASSKPITLEAGWNWLGFIPQYNMDINEALATLNPTEGDVIKSQYQFAVYDNVLKWIGSLKYMIPGEGYMMKCETGAGVLTYPRSGLVAARIESSLPNNLREEEQWKVFPHSYASEMSLLAIIDNDTLIAEGDKLAAISKGIWRGIESPVYDKVRARNLFFMTVYGAMEDKNISFKLKKANGKIYDVKQTMGFENNRLEGTFENPYQLSLLKTDIVPTDILLESVNIQPNPFSNIVHFQFDGMPESSLNIKIANILGVELKQINFNPETASFETFSALQWDGKDKSGSPVSAGTYVVSITSADKTVKKLIIKE